MHVVPGMPYKANMDKNVWAIQIQHKFGNKEIWSVFNIFYFLKRNQYSCNGMHTFFAKALARLLCLNISKCAHFLKYFGKKMFILTLEYWFFFRKCYNSIKKVTGNFASNFCRSWIQNLKFIIFYLICNSWMALMIPVAIAKTFKRQA